MSQYLVPFWDDADTITAYVVTGTDLLGCRLVKISGARNNGNPSVTYAGAADVIFGVSGTDAPQGDNVTVYHDLTEILPVEAGAALTAGQKVIPDSVGRLVPATTTYIGIVLDDCAAGDFALFDRSARAAT